MKASNVQEIERANRQPLNRISREWLEKAGVLPDPSDLHALALIKWALDERAVALEVPGDPDLAGKVEARLQEMENRWAPARTMSFLDSGPPGVSPAQLQQAGSPVDAALMLLQRVKTSVAGRPARES